MTDTERSGSRARKRPAPKPNYTKWSKVFLAHLAATSNVTESARKARICPSTVYDARRAKPDFARRWQNALREGYEHLEMELLQRLRSGEVKTAPADKAAKPSFDNGTAFRLLSLHRETIARQRAIQDDEDEEAILASIDARLDKMRQRQIELSKPDYDGPEDDAQE